MKFTTFDVLASFESEKPKKSVFGNYRIDGNRLEYRAQSSIDAEVRWHGPAEFETARKKLGAMIAKFDGKLSQDGKPVLLEALTVNSPSRGFRVQYYETNVIALKLKNADGTYCYLGNSDVLPLVGRTVAYGNVDDNRDETDIQQWMKRRGYSMIPLGQFTGEVSNFERVAVGPVQTIQHDILTGSSWNKKTVQTESMASAMVFSIDNTYYLFDVDQREANSCRYVSFLAELPRKVKTIDEAYESLKPKLVLDAEARGQKVKRQGGLFFVPCEAPKIPVLSDAQKIQLLAFDSYLPEEVLQYVAGVPRKAHKERAEFILAQVPRTLVFEYRTLSKAIKVDGVLYVKGDVEYPTRTGLRLNDWHIVVPRRGKKTGETDEAL